MIESYVQTKEEHFAYTRYQMKSGIFNTEFDDISKSIRIVVGDMYSMYAPASLTCNVREDLKDLKALLTEIINVLEGAKR